jgi:hypothetical protein
LSGTGAAARAVVALSPATAKAPELAPNVFMKFLRVNAVGIFSDFTIVAPLLVLPRAHNKDLVYISTLIFQL